MCRFLCTAMQKCPHVMLNFKKNSISGHCIIEHIYGSQSLVPRPAAAASLGNLLEMQTVRPYPPGLLNQKLWGPAMF